MNEYLVIMAIPTSRTKENGVITVDQEKCTGCGKCVSVCGDGCLELHEKKSRPGSETMFGCFACGQCMAVCPESAIQINGRCLSSNDIIPFRPEIFPATFDALYSLFLHRRSVRKFRDKPVEKEYIEKILEAAQTAPAGLPPSDVCVKIWDTKEKVHEFSKDYCKYLEKMKWFFSPLFLALMRPFWGKANDEMFRHFLKPLVERYTSDMNHGLDSVTYHAPVAMYFYASPYSDPADPIIAATYAMLAAESLGLGTCMLGAIHPFIQSGSAGEKFREKHGIRFKSREGLFLIMGYRKTEFQRGIRRSFAHIDQLGNN